MEEGKEDQVAARELTIDEMVAKAAERVTVLKHEREGLTAKRKEIGDAIKEVDAEIDKAERVARSLVPRQTKKRAAPAVKAPAKKAAVAPAFNPGSK
jgi:fructose-specific phosphotransferase system component IIB